MIEHIMLARFSVAAENEHSCSGTVNPLTVCARPVCEARRGSHKGKVTVMFGSDPVQPDSLSRATASCKTIT